MTARPVRRWTRLRRDRRGATIVEFAMVILPLTITLLVLFDFGYRMYAQSVLEGTLQRAARLATIGDRTPTQIDDFIKGRLTLFTRTRPPEIIKKSFYQFSGVNKCETQIRNVKAPEGSTFNPDNCLWDQPGECYVDENRDGIFNGKTGAGSEGLGKSDDVIFYSVKVTYRRLFPLGRFLGWPAEQAVSATTVMRNQPYGAQAGLPSATCPA